MQGFSVRALQRDLAAGVIDGRYRGRQFIGADDGSARLCALDGLDLLDFIPGGLAARTDHEHFHHVAELRLDGVAYPDLGKILDPIADKLSQIAIVIILLVKFWDGPLKYILFLFIFKELLMIIGAAILMSKGMRPVAAEIWGKLATVVFYTFMITIIAIGPDGALLSIDFFKGLELNNTVIMIMVIISAILAFASLFGYAPGFIRQLKENKKQSNSSEK